MKKLLTLTLSLLMALSLCLTISAEDNGSNYFKIGDVEYSSLQAALNAVRTSTETNLEIDLIATRTEEDALGSGAFEILSGKNVVLDLNGYTLTLKYRNIACRGNLTIKDSSDAKNGNIIFDGYGSSSGGTHISVGADYETKKEATFTLESGTIKNTSTEGSSTIRVSGFNGTAKVIINGGSIESSGNVACIKANKSGATAEVNGGTFKGSNIFEEENGGKITVSSGTYSNDVSGYLANDSIIVKHNDDYKVYGANDTVSVDEDTKALAGLSSAARKVLNEAGSTADGKTSSIKGYSDINQDLTIDVDSSTQIWLETSLIASETEDVKKATDKAKEVITSNLKYISLDIALKSTYSSEQFSGIATITDLGNDAEGNEIKMPVTLYLSESIAESLKDKIVRVIRIHDGEAELLDEDTTTLTNNALTFYSGKFSTYVIAYGTSSSSGGNTDPVPSTDTTTTTTTSTKSYDAKDKNKDGVVSCEEEMNSANWIWSTSKQACVYKVTNTSVK